MVPDFLAYLGWREALIAVVALLVVYILIAFLRIGRLKNNAAQTQSPAPLAAPTGDAASAADAKSRYRNAGCARQMRFT